MSKKLTTYEYAQLLLSGKDELLYIENENGIFNVTGMTTDRIEDGVVIETCDVSDETVNYRNYKTGDAQIMLKYKNKVACVILEDIPTLLGFKDVIWDVDLDCELGYEDIDYKTDNETLFRNKDYLVYLQNDVYVVTKGGFKPELERMSREKAIEWYKENMGDIFQ